MAETLKGMELMEEGQLDRLLPRTTDEIIADAVASNPAHSTPLSVRLRAARVRARGETQDANKDEIYQEFYDARIREVGGDPDEMLPGNKPRYTCDDDGTVKDHGTGAVYALSASERADIAGTADGVRDPAPVGEAVPDGTGVREQAGGDSSGAALPDPGAPELAGGEHSGAPGFGGQTIDAAAANPTEGNPQATDSPASASGRTPVDQCAEDAHDFGEPERVEESTPCSVCGLTFGEWCAR